jgi:predicted transcriptional regulator
MTVVTIKIANEQDLPELEKFLAKKGLEFEVEEDDEWGDIPEDAIESTKAGMEDFKAGRVVSHAEAMAQINEHTGRQKVNG